MHPDLPSEPVIQTFVLGDFMTNCYVIRPSQESKSCWIADCGYQPDELLDYVVSESLEPEVIVLTHAHADHIAGLFEARTKLGAVPIWIHAAEESWLNDPVANLSALAGLSITGPTPDRLIAHGESLELCGQQWRVAHTPGHSPGGISLIHEPSRAAIVGDALFAGSVGRTDFPGSSHEMLMESIQRELYTLPDETVVYPGHGATTTIGAEKRHNPFVRSE